jgi:hypothetical protein
MSVRLHPQFVVDEKGERRSVLLSIEEFNAMLEEYENFADALALKEAIETSTPEDFEDWDEFSARLRAEGKIE